MTKKVTALLLGAFIALGFTACDGGDERNSSTGDASTGVSSVSDSFNEDIGGGLTEDDFEFDAQTGTIINYFGSIENLEIPRRIGGKAVTGIGDGAFSECNSLVRVTVPSGVTEIGGRAFAYCGSLSSVSIPESVTVIGEGAFALCKSLMSVNIPSGVKRIGENTFYNCTELSSVDIPNSVTEIGDEAFFGCEKLEKIDIPAGVSYIGGGAFERTRWLDAEREKDPLVTVNGILIDGSCCSESTIIPKNVTKISAYAFSSCHELASVTFHDGITDIGEYAFHRTPWLESRRAEDPLVIINGLLIDGKTCSGDVIISDIVTNICGGAFSYCVDLTSATIPGSVAEIGAAAFFDCGNLTSVTINNGVTKIDEAAFGDCYKLTSITIPESVTEIGSEAFGYCESLKSVTVPRSVSKIGDYAFMECVNLVSVTVEDGVTEIGEKAFCDCCNLESITIPKSVTRIGSQAFAYCSALIDADIPDSVSRIETDAFWCCENIRTVYKGKTYDYSHIDDLYYAVNGADSAP